MNALGNAVRGIRNIWGHGDEDDDQDLDASSTPAPNAPPSPTTQGTSPAYASSYRGDKSLDRPAYGGGTTMPTRRPRAVPMALRREKNIYTLKPKNLEETAIAADHLKTGSAVVLNLDDVDRLLATRIIDFMSGVCYGLDHQGHAMKLGDTIFLFTPGEFEISSDETDYGENRDFFFRDAPSSNGHASHEVAPASTAQTVTSSVRISASDIARANAAPQPNAPNVPPSLRDRAWET